VYRNTVIPIVNVHGTFNSPNPDSFGSSDTCPSDRMVPTVSGNRKSLFRFVSVLRLQKSRYSELQIPGISLHMSLQRSTALILSGNHQSRFLCARVLSLELRCSECRFTRISCHASSSMDSPKRPSGNHGSRYQLASVLCLLGYRNAKFRLTPEC